MRACIAVPPLEEYPHRAIAEGLGTLGFEVTRDPAAARCDLLVTWTPWLGSYRHALEMQFRKEGRPVFVIENGWLTPIRGERFYQVASGGWNGGGWFPSGGPSRAAGWGLAFLDWRSGGDWSLVIGQRGHPQDDRTAPPGWHETVKIDGGGVVLRRPRDSNRPLEADLAGARCCHVWTSNVASHALQRGIPVVQHGPCMMMSELASRPGEPLRRFERQAVFERMAWGQWTAAEIAAGIPYHRILAHA